MKKPAARPASGPAPSRFGLSILAGKGQGQRYRLGGAGCMVGRSRGAILFPEDPFVSPHHGTFLIRDGRLFIRDENSLSGIFVTIPAAPEPLVAGACFAAGDRLFRFAGALPRPAGAGPGRPLPHGAPVPAGATVYALEELLVGGRAGRTVVTWAPLLTIGQQHCDLSYPQDRSLAPRHCELSPQGGTATLRDLSGGLGTFVRIPPGTERPLNVGDRVRIGQELLQIEAAA